MQAIFKHKAILGGVVVVVIIGVGYFAFSGSSSGTASTTSGGVTKQAVTQTSASGVSSSAGPGQEFVAQLLAIQNIKLNLELFNDPVFLGLEDFSHDIAPQPISRPNPFAPIDLNELSSSANTGSAAAAQVGAAAGGNARATTTPPAKPAAPKKPAAPVKPAGTQSAGSIFQAVP